MRPNRILIVTLLPFGGLVGCADPPAPATEPEEDRAARVAAVEEPRSPDEPRLYGRTLAFLSSDPDSALAAPWIFTTERTADGEIREKGAWLGRRGSWELLAQETDTIRSALSPWRILPGRSIRLVVGEADRIEALVFRQPPREMETSVGIVLAEWTGVANETVRFHRSTLSLPAATTAGFLLDLARAGEDQAQDWIFLQGGDLFQALLLEPPEAVTEEGDDEGVIYRAWTRLAVREAHWPRVRVGWEELRPFEPARRDIPVRWTIGGEDGGLEGELESVGSHLSAGVGEGPILPVHGFFQVVGEIRMEGDTVPVTGLIGHRQR
jgi:hypothetical protein